MALGYTIHSIVRGKESLPVGTVIDFKDSDYADLIKLGAIRAPNDDELGLYGMTQPKVAALRDGGPTVAEYVAAGYQAANYPPEGWASRSTPEEIDEAVTAQAGNDKPKTPAGDDSKAAKRAAKQAEAGAAKQAEADAAKDPDVTENDALV